MSNWLHIVLLLVVTSALHTRADIDDNEIDDYFQCLEDDVVYQAGETVPSDDPCQTCRCPPTGGQVECDPVTCPVVECVDPEPFEGECCGTCPWGKNCWLNQDILWGDQWVVIPVSNGCSKTCRCPGNSAYQEDGLLTQAECDNPCA